MLYSAPFTLHDSEPQPPQPGVPSSGIPCTIPSNQGGHQVSIMNAGSAQTQTVGQVVMTQVSPVQPPVPLMQTNSSHVNTVKTSAARSLNPMYGVSDNQQQVMYPQQIGIPPVQHVHPNVTVTQQSVPLGTVHQHNPLTVGQQGIHVQQQHMGMPHANAQQLHSGIQNIQNPSVPLQTSTQSTPCGVGMYQRLQMQPMQTTSIPVVQQQTVPVQHSGLQQHERQMGMSNVAPNNVCIPQLPEQNNTHMQQIQQVNHVQPFVQQSSGQISPNQGQIPLQQSVPAKLQSQGKTSPVVPLEEVSRDGQKLYKFVGSQGKVQYFKPALDDSTVSVDQETTMNQTTSDETPLDETVSSVGRRPTLQKLSSPEM